MRKVARALVLLLLTTVAACHGGGGGGGATTVDTGHPMVGAPAPDFDLPAQVGGARASLAAARGKVVIVDFWATWCAPCRASFPKYQALLREFGDDLVIIGISEDEDASGIEEFAEETGATFLLAWDEGQSVSAAYKPETMPTSYIVDGNGLVRSVHTGFVEGDEASIRATLSDLLR